jgi:hypothetical protein
MESPHGLEIGKIAHNVQPGSVDFWSHPDTVGVLEVLGGSAIKNGLEVGSTCKLRTRVVAQLPPEYNISLPDYAGESDVFDLFNVLQSHYGGQGDPIYQVQSRGSRDNISLTELYAIESLLEDITAGKYMPGYPHGQLAPADMPMGMKEEEEYTEEQEAALEAMRIAEDWLPEIRELISENSEEENESY